MNGLISPPGLQAGKSKWDPYVIFGNVTNEVMYVMKPALEGCFMRKGRYGHYNRRRVIQHAAEADNRFMKAIVVPNDQKISNLLNKSSL